MGFLSNFVKNIGVNTSGSSALEVRFSLNSVYFLRNANDTPPSEGIYGGLVSDLEGISISGLLDVEVDGATIGEKLGVSNVSSYKVNGLAVAPSYVLSGSEKTIALYVTGESKGF
jgi:hypothetical protein